MKIIGLGDETVILQANRNEVANLLNFYSKYDNGFPKLVADMEINIEAFYRNATRYKNALSNKKLDDIRNALETMLNLITPLQVVAEKVNSEINEEV
jgi:hypothetical protein